MWFYKTFLASLVIFVLLANTFLSNERQFGRICFKALINRFVLLRILSLLIFDVRSFACTTSVPGFIDLFYIFVIHKSANSQYFLLLRSIFKLMICDSYNILSHFSYIILTIVS